MNAALVFTIVTLRLADLRTVAEGNDSRHWRHRYRRAQLQRHAVYIWLRHQLHTPTCLPWPMTITLTRIAPRRLDDVAAIGMSLKHVQDGVSDFLFACPGEGHRHDNDPRLTWHYVQRRGAPREYAVEMTFMRRDDP